MANELRVANVAVILEKPPQNFKMLRVANVVVIYERGPKIATAGRIQGPPAQMM